MYQNQFKQKTIELADKARRISVLMFGVAIIQALMTVFIRVGSHSDPTEVYSRNISSVLCLLFLGEFLSIYSSYHKSVNVIDSMKSFKTISLILSLAGLVKTVISAFYTLKYFVIGNTVAIYYFGEVLVWLAVALFAFSYYRRMKMFPTDKFSESDESQD